MTWLFLLTVVRDEVPEGHLFYYRRSSHIQLLCLEQRTLPLYGA